MTGAGDGVPDPAAQAAQAAQATPNAEAAQKAAAAANAATAAAVPAPGVDGVGGVRALFFTRVGGVSAGAYAGLNAGYGSGDARDAVAENRARIAAGLGVAPARLLTAHQVHSADAIAVDGPWGADGAPRRDALATRAVGLGLGALAADCAPVLLSDAEAGVIAAAHAGWRGALSGVIGAAVACMESLGAARGRIRAAIGPCIRQPAYQVGADLRDAVLADDPAHAALFAEDPAPGRWRFDLAGLVARRLAQAGVGEVADVRLCTHADPARFYSYRRGTQAGEPHYGRLLAGIARAEGTPRSGEARVDYPSR